MALPDINDTRPQSPLMRRRKRKKNIVPADGIEYNEPMVFEGFWKTKVSKPIKGYFKDHQRLNKDEQKIRAQVRKLPWSIRGKATRKVLFNPKYLKRMAHPSGLVGVPSRTWRKRTHQDIRNAYKDVGVRIYEEPLLFALSRRFLKKHRLSKMKNPVSGDVVVKAQKRGDLVANPTWNMPALRDSHLLTASSLTGGEAGGRTENLPLFKQPSRSIKELNNTHGLVSMVHRRKGKYEGARGPGRVGYIGVGARGKSIPFRQSDTRRPTDSSLRADESYTIREQLRGRPARGEHGYEPHHRLLRPQARKVQKKAMKKRIDRLKTQPLIKEGRWFNEPEVIRLGGQ